MRTAAATAAGLRAPLLAPTVVGDLEEEPGASFGLIDQSLDQARRGDIAVLGAQPVRFAQPLGELRIVIAKLGQHLPRWEIISIVVDHALQPSDMADGAQR